MRTFIAFYIVSFLLIPPLAHGKPLTLHDAQVALIANNPDIAAARQERIKSERILDEAKGLWYPSVDIIGSTTWFTDSSSIALNSPAGKIINKIGPLYKIESGIDISYPVTQALVNINNVRYRSQGLRTKDAANSALINQYSLKLGMTYLAWQLSAELAASQQALIKQLTHYTTQIENQKKSGIVAQARVLEARARLSMAEVDLLSANNFFDSLRLEIGALCGLGDTALTPSPFDTASSMSTPAALDTTTMNPHRPELASIDSAINQLKTFELITSGQKYPNLIVFAGYRFSNPGLQMNTDKFMNYGLAGAQLRWNIFDGFRVHNQRAQFRVQQDVLLQNRKALSETFTRLRGQALLQVHKSAALEAAAHQALIAAQALATDLQNSLEAGVVTNVDYLNALTQVTKAELALKQARFAKNAALLQLYFASGKELAY